MLKYTFQYAFMFPKTMRKRMIYIPSNKAPQGDQRTYMSLFKFPVAYKYVA